MFTGLVEEKGVVAAVESDGDAAKLIRVACEDVHKDSQIGASVAINGCCLTVVSIDGAILSFQAGNETLSRTNLGELKSGDGVNLERALKTGDRLGGHYVSGHVDSIGKVAKRIDEQDWSYFWFEVPDDLTVQMASKGSITVDGVSLTLVDVELKQFSVALIPHTLEVTTLGDRQEGDSVNIETDILAKYVQQQMNRQALEKK